MKLGAPTGEEFTELFGDQGHPLYAIHFEQVLPEDLPKECPLQNDVCLMGPNLQEHRKLIYMHQGVYIYIYFFYREIYVWNLERTSSLYFSGCSSLLNQSNQIEEIEHVLLDRPISPVRFSLDCIGGHQSNG